MQTKYPKIYAEWKSTGLPLHDFLQNRDIYISVYPHTHHKHGMFYASVVQCFSQVYYSYYELQDDDTYEWKTTTVHHTEFESTAKEISNATYKQARNQAIQMAFALIHNDNFQSK